MLKVEKKVIGNLEKCYAMAVLKYQGKDHFLVAAEKANQCRMYSLGGELEEVVWNEPGGVMTMVQVPETDGQFLATHKFYSPNDSKEARIIIAEPKGKNDWMVRTLVNLPFVHRFDIIQKNGVSYLLACTLQSDHEYKDDFRSPGKVYAAVLPADLSGLDEEHPLKMKVIKDGMTRNHGYCRCSKDGRDGSVISCEEGVFWFEAPDAPRGEWKIEQLSDEAASDAMLIDLDGDGEEELFTMLPFHGDTIRIYKKCGNAYAAVYEYPEKLEFLHAISGGNISGEPTVVVGHRKGERRLLAFRSDKKGGYTAECLDEHTGAANLLHYTDGSKEMLLATNREIDEIAMYTLQEKE